MIASSLEPRIDVILPVYKFDNFLPQTIESLRNQSFKNFRVLLICWAGDSETQVNCEELLKEFNHEILTVPPNSTLSVSLNLGISHSHAPYIARIDSDDLCDADRFLEQLEFLDDPRNKDIKVLGSNLKTIDKNGSVIGSISYPLSSLEIKKRMLYHNALAHPSLMIRRSVFNDFRYNPSNVRSQDYELWLRSLPTCEFANIDKPLVLYRIHNSQHSRSRLALSDLIWITGAKFSAFRQIGANPFKVFGVHMLWVLSQIVSPTVSKSIPVLLFKGLITKD